MNFIFLCNPHATYPVNAHPYLLTTEENELLPLISDPLPAPPIARDMSDNFRHLE